MNDPLAPTPPTSESAVRLLEHHTRISETNPKGAGRHKNGCTCARCAAANKGRPAPDAKPPASPSLPPGTALPEVMASAGSLFFNIHATLLDDPNWNISPVQRTEIGNILSFMLADDFYRMGGIGKYVVGGVLLLSIYSLKASETAALRKRRLEEKKLTASRVQQPPAAPVPTVVVPEQKKNEDIPSWAASGLGPGSPPKP